MTHFFTFIVLSFFLLSCKGVPTPKNQKEGETIACTDSITRLTDHVSIIFQDSKGNYWFANEGAVKFDGSTYTRFTTEDGLQSNSIHTIKEDHLGNIYFDTGEGICQYDGSKMTPLTVIEDSTKAKQLRSTDLWFAGNWNMNGAYRWDGEYLYQLRLSNHPFEEEFLTAYPNPSYSPYSVYTTYVDRSGHVWLGGAVFGACRFDGESFFWISEREMTEMDPGPSMGIRAIAQDGNGDFYFGSNVNTKYRMVEKDGKVDYTQLEGADTRKNEAVNSACMSLVIDDEENIWMAHYKDGVWKFDGTEFTHYPVLHEGEEAELFSIYIDRKGCLWLGTNNAGAYRWTGEKFEKF